MKTHAAARRIARIVAQLAWAGVLTGQNEPTLRITVNRVEVDAVVTGSDGRAVTDLTAADFEILQDGRPQPVSSAQWISWAAPGPEKKAAAPPVASARNLERPQVRRTIAFLLDDLGLSGESVKRSRDALKTWVRDRMGPNDLVAVLTTGRSMGALGQFTSDKRLLLAALDQLRFNPTARVGATSLAPMAMAPEVRVARLTRGNFGALADPEPTRQRLLMDTTLGVLSDVLRGLHRYPGRKSLVLVSESMFINIDNREVIQKSADTANRSFVVIHAVDPRGLLNANANAADDTADLSSRTVEARTNSRRLGAFLSQNGLDHLARETGGSFLANGNDLARLVTGVLDGAGGYWLLTYRPDDETFTAKQTNKWHRLEVRVKRPGVAVHARGGFFGTPETAAPSSDPATPVTLADALRSPFAAAGIPVRLTGYHVEDPKDGSVVAALLHIDAHDLTLEPDANGNFKGTLDLSAAAITAEGKVEGQRTQSFDLTLKPDAVEQVKQQGLVYTMYQPVKHSGGFQLRVGVQDRKSGRLGTATQFVEVPEVKGGPLVLSSMIVQSPVESAPGSPAVRQFAPKSSLVWGARILNARRGKGNAPQLTHQLVIYRDGKQVLQTQPEPWSGQKADDPLRLPVGGMLEFGGGMGPGDYVLELIVRDLLQTDPKRAVASQAIDFEVKAP